jgi:hypothetical protein
LENNKAEEEKLKTCLRPNLSRLNSHGSNVGSFGESVSFSKAELVENNLAKSVNHLSLKLEIKQQAFLNSRMQE